MNPRLLFISLLMVTMSYYSFCQELVPLWDNVPNQTVSNDKEKSQEADLLWITNVQNPTLEVYLPTKRNSTGQGVIICPGGAYLGLAYDWEGTDIAKYFNSKGIAAFVLKYRLPVSKSINQRQIAPLQDAQRAIRKVRYHSEKWNIDPGKVGIMGFSAGGHLASTLGTHFNDVVYDQTTEIDDLMARPDFIILVYPVITMNSEFTHGGSKNNLLGENPSQELIEKYSNELQVTENTPPTFLVHASDDDEVSVMNSILFYQALIENNVPAEMHIYPTGGHGFSLAIGKGHHNGWNDRMIEWLDYINK